MSAHKFESLLAEDPEDKSTGWQSNFTRKESDGISCKSYGRVDPSNGMLMNRSLCMFRGCKIESMQ